jgi:lysophospholipase L1-like esterase
MTLSAVAQEKSVALTPVPRNDDWWTKRHAEKVELMKQGNVDLLMVGDSITHGWENQKDVWEKFYTGRNILNYGFSGDRTEHVLWRLQNSPLNAIRPKAITIMIGTNNIGHGSSSPKDTADGIRAIVGLLQKQYPDAKIFVLYVFPRDEKPDGDLRQKVNEINGYLPALLGRLNNVTLIDIGHLFLNDDGVLPKTIMPDFLHPNKDGYLIWGNAVEPILKPIFE